MRRTRWIWLGPVIVAMLATVPPSSAWAQLCGDNFPGPGSDTPCKCGDTVVTHTALKPSDPVTRGTCDPSNSGPGLVALKVEGGVRLDMTSPSVHIRCAGGVSGLVILGSGVVIKGGSSIIEGCHVGVHVVSSAPGTTVERVVARRSVGFGFEIHSSGNTLIRNFCEDSEHGAGILVEGNSNGNLLESNYCHGNNANGILVRGNGNTLTDNLCHDNGHNGIQVAEGTGNILNRNYCSGNGMHGIHVATSGNSLSRNQGTTNGDQGVVAIAGNSSGKNNYALGNKKFPQCHIPPAAGGNRC